MQAVDFFYFTDRTRKEKQNNHTEKIHFTQDENKQKSGTLGKIKKTTMTQAITKKVSHSDNPNFTCKILFLQS